MYLYFSRLLIGFGEQFLRVKTLSAFGGPVMDDIKDLIRRL
jgi:hypothetical protein